MINIYIFIDFLIDLFGFASCKVALFFPDTAVRDSYLSFFISLIPLFIAYCQQNIWFVKQIKMIFFMTFAIQTVFKFKYLKIKEFISVTTLLFLNINNFPYFKYVLYENVCNLMYYWMNCNITSELCNTSSFNYFYLIEYAW